ncbi:MAG TPA: toll/interleukin-1 receptor domain-containing protein [Anaerolineales bacterium]|nr:toll/interleukin-1 receptor domain-containing protein [Anaerolineales bacterium]
MNRLLHKSEFNKKSAIVFLCYSHTDRDAVRLLCSRLKKGGVEVWLDSAKLLPGQNWKDEIHKAIIRSQVVIVCLSRNFNKQKGFRHEELKIALEQAALLPDDEIFIIPARLKNCDTPDSLRHLHRVDLFEADGYKKLMQALRKQIALM